MPTRYLRASGAVVRSRPMFWVSVFGELVVAGMVASLVSMHGPLALVTAALPWYLAGALLWWFMAMPRVELEEHRIRVVNPVRTHELKYADLVDVTTRYGLHLVTRHRTVQAMGAPAGGAASMMWSNKASHVQNHPDIAYRGPERTVMPSDFRNTASGRAAETIRGHWQEQLEAGTLQGPEGDPVSTVNVRQLAVLAVLAVLAAGYLLLG